jgi:hypothetical protein
LAQAVLARCSLRRGSNAVDLHLERELRLHTEPKRGWAINEIGADGQQIGSDQIPWEWSFNFTATSCELADTFEISQPLNFKFKVTAADGTVTEKSSGDGKGPTIDQREIIRAQLRPGHPREDADYWRQTTFSMFGTDRAIKDFRLEVHPLANPADQEQCSAWGCVSYTMDIDFRDETTDDCIIFHVFVKPEAFARYVTKVANGWVNELILRVGAVHGFYSEWSPSISTRNVKVLTADRDHKVTLPPDHQDEPLRLGYVGEVHLYINRYLELGKQAPSPVTAEAATEIETDPAQAQAPAAGADPRMLKMLRSLRRAAWFIVWLLALIFVLMLMRRL